MRKLTRTSACNPLLLKTNNTKRKMRKETKIRKVYLLTLTLIFCNFMMTSQCWSKISTGLYYSMGIKTDGSLWAWGDNLIGQLGDGTGINKPLPTQVGTSTNWVRYTESVSASGRPFHS